MFDPGIDEAVEIEEEKVAHVVQKLMDLDELMPRSSWAHLVTELDTQHEKVDESTIYCGYGCKNTKTRKKGKEEEERATSNAPYIRLSDVCQV